jgi:AcrR family transcriptional regulator
MDVIVEEGFAHASVEDLASSLNWSKTRLYSIADSKERIIAAVRRFFRRATLQVEGHRIGQDDPVGLIRVYPMVIAAALARATSASFADIDGLA